MVLNNKDFTAIDKAAAEFFQDGKIITKCPRCGGEMVCVEHGASFVVKCGKNNCISEKFVGV